MRCLRHAIRAWTPRYHPSQCSEPRAQAYSFMRLSYLLAGTVRCAIGIDAATGPLRFHGTARPQECVVGHDKGSGGEHARRRIGEYPHFDLHVCCLSLPSRPTTCAYDGLSLSFMTTRTDMYYLRRSRRSCLLLALRRSRSNAARTFPIPSHVQDLASSSPLTADSCPAGCSSCSRVIFGPGFPPDRSC